MAACVLPRGHVTSPLPVTYARECPGFESPLHSHDKHPAPDECGWVAHEGCDSVVFRSFSTLS